MTPEDRLRQILQAEADDLIPVGDGLRRIEQRLADRRSLRSRLVPALAIAGVVAIAGAAAITVSVTDDGSLKQPPAHHTTPAPVPTGCAGGLCEEPKPSPSLSTTGVTTSASGIPLWPVTTDAQAADWERGSNTPRWESDPVQVTQHLMDDYLKLPGQAVLFDNSGDVAVVTVSAGGRTVSTVRLVRVGRDPDGPWSVTGAASLVLAVTQPNDGDEVSSPISTAGTVNDVDQSVHLRLMSDRVLGEAFQPAGRDQPWTHALQWTGADWSVAALVANTFNGKGDLSAVSITAVRRANADAVGLPPPGTTFVAIEDGHVVLADALSGATLRQISYPPNYAVDASPDEGGSDGVVWVRTVRGCLSSILRAGLAHGPAGVTVDPKPVRMLVPSLSHGGRSLGWGAAGLLRWRPDRGRARTGCAVRDGRHRPSRRCRARRAGRRSRPRSAGRPGRRAPLGRTRPHSGHDPRARADLQGRRACLGRTGRRRLAGLSRQLADGAVHGRRRDLLAAARSGRLARHPPPGDRRRADPRGAVGPPHRPAVAPPTGGRPRLIAPLVTELVT
jgi:hypothetical protein